MKQVLALSGGVGGAKLALGLARELPPDALTVVVNTGDDFRHLGLAISPDVDTLLYTLSGLADPDQGWGRRDEGWRFMDALGQLGGPTWFRLGDADLAMHVERTRRLALGETAGAVTDHFRQRLQIATKVVPMSDDEVRTRVRTEQGWVDFQDYFVRQRCQPVVREIVFDGACAARPCPALANLADEPTLQAVVVCPSNPWLSVDPILALPGVREALRRCPVPVVGVSPLVGGRAVKGPTAKLMAELGLRVDHAAIASHFQGLIDVLLVDERDPGLPWPDGVECVVVPTLMQTLADRDRLARAVLDVAGRITPRRPR